jgi:hypothetical protein
MTVVVGDLAFDNVAYDGDADVLYLHVGDPAEAVEFGSRRRATPCAMTPRGTSWASPS